MCDDPPFAPSLAYFKSPHAPINTSDNTAAAIPALKRAFQGSDASAVFFKDAQTAVNCFLKGFSESSLYPPVTSPRQLGTVSTSYYASSLNPVRTQQRLRSNAPASGGSETRPDIGIPSVGKSTWEEFQENTVANAAYEAKVRQAKRLLYDFQRYQQEQNSSYTINRNDNGRGVSERHVPLSDGSSTSIHAQSGCNRVASSCKTRGTHTCHNVAALPRPAALSLPQDTEVSHIQNTASLPEDPALMPSAPPTGFNPNAIAAANNDSSGDSGSFDLLAFEVAKQRARRLLLYNAKVRAAFSDQGLSLARAVYKELMRHPPPAPPQIPYAKGNPNTTTTPAEKIRPAGMESKVVHSANRPSCNASAKALSTEKESVDDQRVKKGLPVGGFSPSSLQSAAAAAEAEMEAKRALDLLCSIRVMRRQTEELTVALLHACGEWNCWVDPPAAAAVPSSTKRRPEKASQAPMRQHLFADLFLGGCRVAATTDDTTPTESAVEANNTVTCFEEGTCDRRTRACAGLRKALHLFSKADGATNSAAGLVDDMEEACAGPCRFAVAFLRLAESPALRAVPPPPPATIQFELFANQQRFINNAPQSWSFSRNVHPSTPSHKSAITASRNGLKALTKAQQTHQQYHGQQVKSKTSFDDAALSMEVGGVYSQFQQQLNALRAQRQIVQQTYEAVCSAAALTPTKVEDKRQLSPSRLDVSSPSQRRNSPVWMRSRAAEGITTPNNDHGKAKDQPVSPSPTPRHLLPAALTHDTLLSSPPELLMEKTRPWVDSVDRELVSRLALPGQETSPKKDLLRKQQEIQNVIQVDAAKARSAGEADSSAPGSRCDGNDDRKFESSNSANNAALPLVKVMALAAATARFHSSSLLSSASSEEEPSCGRVEEEKGAATLNREIESEHGCCKSKQNVSTTQNSELAEARQSFASVEGAGMGGEVVTDCKNPASTNSAKQTHPLKEALLAASTGATSSSTCQVGEVQAADKPQERDEAKSVEVELQDSKRHALRSPFIDRTKDEEGGEDSTLSKDDGSAGCDTFFEGSYIGSSTSFTSTTSREMANNMCVSPHACAASWRPHMFAALSTHPGVAEAAERQAQQESGDGKHQWIRKNHQQQHRADRCSIGGLDANVFRELSQWLAAQQGKKTKNWDQKNAGSTAGASTLSSEELRALSMWLRGAERGKKKSKSANRKGKNSVAEPSTSESFALPSPPPPVVQRALQIVIPGYAPSPKCLQVSIPNEAASAATAQANREKSRSSGDEQFTEPSSESQGLKKENSSGDSEGYLPVNPPVASNGSHNLTVAASQAQPETPEAAPSVPIPAAQDASHFSPPALHLRSATLTSSSFSLSGREEAEAGSREFSSPVPPMHPHVDAAASVPELQQPQPTNTDNPCTGREKVVESQKKKSVFRCFFPCGG